MTSQIQIALERQPAWRQLAVYAGLTRAFNIATINSPRIAAMLIERLTDERLDRMNAHQERAIVATLLAA